MDKPILKAIADNQALLKAVRETIEAEFQATSANLARYDLLEDKALGEIVRAQLTGMKAVALAFEKIEQYKTASGVGEKINPAR